MSPDWSSKMVPNPALTPAGEGQQGQDSGEEHVQHGSGGEAADSRELFEKGSEQDQVEDGRRETDEEPHRIAQHLAGVPLEQESGVAGRFHAATSLVTSVPASRNERPV